MITKPLRLFLCAIFCFSYTLCSAQYQQKTVDSLLTINTAYVKKDTRKVELLLELSKVLMPTRGPAETLIYARQALSLSETLNDKKLIGESALTIGVALTQQSNHTEAIKYKQQALSIFKELHAASFYADALFRLGDDYGLLLDPKQALDYYLKAYDTYKQLNVPLDEIKCLVQIGDAYKDMGSNQKALEYDFMALKIAERVNDKLSVSNCYFNIAIVQNAVGNYKEAVNYYQKALTIKVELNDVRKQSLILDDLAISYFNLNDTDAALKYFDQSLELAKILGNKTLLISATIGVGDIYHQQGKYNESVARYKTALIVSKEIKDQRSAGYALISLGTSYIADGKFQLAEDALKSADSLFRKPGAAYERQVILEQYSLLYEAAHQYNKALASYKRFVATRDSIINIDIKNQVLKKEMQYDFDKKESTYQLNAAIAAKNLAQQHSLSLQQHQQLMLEQQKLVLSNKEKSLQRITYLSQQAKLENDKKLQASQLQKSTLQAKLQKQVADAEIFKQDEEITSAGRQRALLLILLAAAVVITSLIFYNQLKTNKLNKVILAQKQDLENINAVKDRMFGIVSHDMRAPVNTLIAFNALLEHDNLTPDKMKAYANEIKKTLNHTSVLMENLLNWSSSQMQGYKPEFDSHALKEISNDAMNSVSDRAFQKNISLKNTIDDNARVFADKNMTELIMRNILSNAIKYTRDGGLIELTAGQQGAKTTFTITDNGVGMNEDQVMRFNSADYSYSRASTPGTQKEKGSGLGLVLCKTFTAMMHGDIVVQSVYGKGTTFTVTLPQQA